MASSFLNQTGLPLGLRNNNPGNLRPLPGGTTWKGEIQRDTVNNFSRFSDVAWGLRAMITDITGDIVNDGQNTIRKLVTAYAPPGDNNNTEAYIASVAATMGISPNQVLTANRETIERLVKAKLKVELGASSAAKITQQDINEAFDRLGSNVLKWLKNAITNNPGTAIGLLILVGALLYGGSKNI